MKASPFTALLSPHRQRRRRADGDSVAEIAREEGASEPTADPQRLVEHSSRGQSRIPELNWAHVAQRRMHPLPAAPPDAWVGLAAEPAEVGGRPPIGELLLQGPAGGLDGRVVARVALAGGGLRISNASGRSSMPGFANSLPVYCQALADKIGVMISTLSAFRVPTSFSIPEIYQA